MAHDYSAKNSVDAKTKAMKKPQKASLTFIRQFARTYVVLHGMNIVLN